MRIATEEAIAAMKADRAKRIAQLVHRVALRQIVPTPIHLQVRHDKRRP